MIFSICKISSITNTTRLSNMVSYWPVSAPRDNFTPQSLRPCEADHSQQQILAVTKLGGVRYG